MQVEITPYASRFPKMDNSADSNAADLRTFAMQVVSGMQHDSGNIIPMYKAMEKRAADKLAQEASVEYFTHVTTVNKLDVVWVSQWLTNNTNFTTMEILACTRRDPESPMQMFLFETQWPPTLRLNLDCLHKETFGRLSTHRSVAAGKRLNKLKARGGCQDGVLDWSFGCYEFPVVDKGRVKAIKHISDKQIAVPDHMTILTDFDFQANWDDFGAQVRKPPLQPQKLWQLMESECKEAKEGPWAIETYTGGNCKAFNTMFASEYKALMASRAALNQSQISDAVSTGIQQLKAEKRAAGLTEARKRGAEVLETKKKRRSITVRGPAGQASPAQAAAPSAENGEEDAENDE